MAALLIKNAVVVNAGGRQNADVLIEDGTISRVEAGLNANGAEMIDARGAWLLPGLVDLHCHLRDPGYEYKEDIVSGSRAAAAGGFTSVLCMANTRPINDCGAITRYIVDKAREAGYANVYPIGAVSKDLLGQEMAELGDMLSAGAVAFSDDGSPVKSSYLMELAMRYAKQFGAFVISHPEDTALSEGGVMHRGVTASLLGLPGIPRSAEEAMIARDLLVARENDCPVHIAHLSTAGGVELVRWAKRMGVRATCETTPHYLLLDDTACEGYDTAARVSPPLREPADREALIAGLLDGTVDAIATDHAPHHIDDKEVEFAYAASGISGFETAFAACHTVLVASGRMNLEQLVDKMSARPAAIARLAGGRIEVGAPGDLVLADAAEWTVDPARFLSKGKNTPMRGMTLSGRVLRTFLGGRTTYRREGF